MYDLFSEIYINVKNQEKTKGGFFFPALLFFSSWNKGHVLFN